MDSIPDDLLLINAADPAALIRLLDLPELVVTRLERPAWLGRLILLCQPRATSAPCPDCGQPRSAIHQYQRRTVRDLPWAGWPCYLEITCRRFWCPAYGRPFTEPLAALAPYARTTCRFADHLVASVRSSTVADPAWASGHGYKAVEGLFYRHAAATCPPVPPGLVRRLGIDEIAPHKGHGACELVLSDLDTGRVIAHLPDRQQETLRGYLATWSAEQRAAVEEVATDFWAAYHTVVAECLPQARVVGDRFHVQQHWTEAVSATRRAVQPRLGAADREFVRRARYLLVRNEEDLSAAEWMRLEVIKTGVPELGVVHTLKEEFRAIFNAPLERATAAEQVGAWLERAWSSGVAALADFAGFVERWREPILSTSASGC